MSGPMYFKPHPEDIARAKASTCHMATPKDASDCIGRRCGSWNSTEDKPCAGYRPRPTATQQADGGDA